MTEERKHSCVAIDYANGSLIICEVCGQIRSQGAISFNSMPCEEAEAVTKSHDWKVIDQGHRHYSELYECQKCGVQAQQDVEVKVPFYPYPCEGQKNSVE